MVTRKQTPDVLDEILGGEPVWPEEAPAARPRTAPKRTPPGKGASRQPRAKHPTWEYLEVVFRDYGGYRPRHVNGQEQAGWKQAPLIHAYLNQLGEQGWELAGISSRHNDQMLAFFKRRAEDR